MAIVSKAAAGITVIAAFISLTAACNDPSVRVSLQIPDPMRDQVRRLTLDVLVPPSAEPFDCEKVAFQEVSAEAVALSGVVHVEVAGDRDATPIDDIPREGTKLFLARGLDGQDDPIIAGCGELDLIDSDEVVDIVAEPVTILDPPPLPVGSELPSPIRFGLTDVAGHAMAGKTVKWAVYGPGGNPTTGTALTNGDGDAMLAIDVPTWPGPAAVLARARWMADEPEPVVGFHLTTPIVIDVPVTQSAVTRNARSALVGKFGPAGEPAIAVFGSPSGGASGRAVFIAYRDGASYTTVESPPMIGLLTMGKVRTGGREQLFAVIADRWIEIRADGTLSPTVLATSGVTADEIASIGPCGGDGVDVALIRSGTQWVAIDADKQPTSSPFATPPDGATRLIGSGCVSTTTGALRRTVVYAGEMTVPTVVADANGLRSTPWVTFGQSAGFSRSLGGGASAPLLGVEVDTDGVSIARYELLTVGSDELELQKIDEDDVITVPQTPVGADLDGDGVLDVAALLDFGLTDDSDTSFRAMVALGVDVEGTRLAGASEEMQARGVQLLVGDADGDNDDDLVLVSEGQIKIVLTGGAQ